MKIAVKNASATPIVHPIALEEICSSSGIWRFADHVRAFMPSVIDSASAITPRTSGIFDHFSAQVGVSWVSISMSPSGVRTAIAYDRSPRIMTPSTTAWPPM